MVFGKHLIFVDESGDHGLLKIDPEYPLFVLVFCLIKKEDYVRCLCPALQELKLRFWGHDEQVLHEHEIRKPNKHYAFLFDSQLRSEFMDALSQFVDQMPFHLVGSVIKKGQLGQQYAFPHNPYELSLKFGLERLFLELETHGDADKVTHVIVESRGQREDAQLELAFRRTCDGENFLNKVLPFDLVMIPKSANSAGLQLADLVARPLGINVLRPSQCNRAYNILSKKLRRSPTGKTEGWGLKIFP
jgi:hypothetical protein